MSSHGELRHRSQSQKRYVEWLSGAASCRSLPSQNFFFFFFWYSIILRARCSQRDPGTVKPSTGPRIIRTEGGGGLWTSGLGLQHSHLARLTPEKIFSLLGVTDCGFCCLRPRSSSSSSHQPYSSCPHVTHRSGWADRGPRVTVECSSGRDSPLPPWRPGLAFASSGGRDGPRMF